ncbi:MAG: UDP-N-acetylglucosamine 2-epimerase (non-hydrolyzing) [Muribaculaceae bacterium]|nr:UDP-N-acetylglucosamine 2-epimerase (non-hydrolyzing) [Muribaculaceae bacterium]
MKKKVLLAFGTRPEAIKMAPLVNYLKADQDRFETLVAVTGQHREMLDQVLALFGIKPDYDLNIMKPGQDLYDVTSRILLGMRDVLDSCKPDLVLVHGDTSTSTAVALSAFYKQIPVGHVEAGLRTHDIYNPWPEEMNRQITGRIASLHFSPTALSRDNLLKENVDPARITITGNTVIDALCTVVDKIKGDKALSGALAAKIKGMGYDTDRLNSRRLVLITGHRRENFGEGFKNICNAILDLSNKYPDVDFLYPMHLNPNVRRPIAEIFGNVPHNNVFFIEPVDYLPFVYLMTKSYVILTDSGGIQEEAPTLGIPVLVMRKVTERPEALEAGTIRLVGTDRNLIVDEVSRFLDDADYYACNQRIVNPYGDGHASERIADFIVKNI